ncbi:hypothetical protein [Campylobacter pinnipediorum]|uniref:hypothetical protein n=1 Tax=Campylobacter pinnipediorum TaxID=1965231 RepID=UPI0009955808|nr:hypothetical protein [Campylobacter pinnipediorum]
MKIDINFQKTTMKFKKLFIIYLIFWLCLSGFGLAFADDFFYSSQIGYFCSIFIAFVSYKSYKRRVLKKLKDKNELDEFEEEYEEEQPNDDVSLEDEKRRLKTKKLKLKDMNLDMAFVPYRLFAYAFFVIGFFLLKRHDVLNVFGILVGLSMMPIGALVLGFLQRNETK